MKVHDLLHHPCADLSLRIHPSFEALKSLDQRNTQIYFMLQSVKGVAACLALTHVYRLCFPELFAHFNKSRKPIGSRLNPYTAAVHHNYEPVTTSKAVCHAFLVSLLRNIIFTSVGNFVVYSFQNYTDGIKYHEVPYIFCIPIYFLSRCRQILGKISGEKESSATSIQPQIIAPTIVNLAIDGVLYKYGLWVMNPLKALQDGLLGIPRITMAEFTRLGISIPDVTAALVATCITSSLVTVISQTFIDPFLGTKKAYYRPSSMPQVMLASTSRQLLPLGTTIMALMVGNALLSRAIGGPSVTEVPLRIPFIKAPSFIVPAAVIGLIGHSFSFALAEGTVLALHALANVFVSGKSSSVTQKKINRATQSWKNEFASVVGRDWDNLSTENKNDIAGFLRTLVIHNAPSRITVQYGAIRLLQLIHNLTVTVEQSSVIKGSTSLEYTAPRIRSDATQSDILKRKAPETVSEYNQEALRMFDALDIIYSEYSSYYNDFNRMQDDLLQSEYIEYPLYKQSSSKGGSRLVSECDIIRQLEPDMRE